MDQQLELFKASTTSAKYLLPNGNNLLGTLRPGKIIRHKVTVLDDFVDHETWFSWTKEKCHEMMVGSLSTADGL